MFIFNAGLAAVAAIVSFLQLTKEHLKEDLEQGPWLQHNTILQNDCEKIQPPRGCHGSERIKGLEQKPEHVVTPSEYRLDTVNLVGKVDYA